MSMSAVHCVAWGEPEQLRLERTAIPVPARGEVRLRVLAAGVNFPDALVIQRKYQLQPQLPFSPGHELCGIVDAVGEGVDLPRPGTRVAAFTSGIGAFAEYACVAAARTFPVPQAVPDEVAAAFTVTYATTEHALADRAALQPRETLLVLGAGGGVGLAAVELGKMSGARVLAAASTEEKLEAARLAGADAAINYSTQDLREAVRSLTDGHGVDVAYDPVGGGYTEPALRSLAWRGRLLVVGFANGEIPKIPANLLLLKGASAVGVFWGDFARREPARNAALISGLLDRFADGTLRPPPICTYPLARAGEALRALLDRRAVGKLVLRP